MIILITSGILKLRDTSILSLAVFMVIIGDLIRAFNRLLHHTEIQIHRYKYIRTAANFGF